MNDNNSNNQNGNTNDPKKKPGCISIIILLLLVSVVYSGITRHTSGSGSSDSEKNIKYSSYKSVISDFEKALNNADGALMCKTMLPTEQYHSVPQQTIVRINSEWGISMGLIKEMYKNYKFKLSIKGKTELSADDLLSIQKYYSYYFEGNCPDIEEGYSLEIQFKSFDGEKETVFLNVICFEGDGWRVAEQSAGFAFAVPSPVAQTGGGGFDG